MILILLCSHLVWGCAVVSLWSFGSISVSVQPVWSILFAALQLYFAAQLILPALLLHPEERNRSFYLFWGVLLVVLVMLVNQLPAAVSWRPFLDVAKSSLLLLMGTVIGAALARYVKRLWEIIPVCIVMTMADFASWLIGPTADFVRDLEQYYRTMDGPPPLVDMILVKLAFPGMLDLAPVFGVSDWIMVVFFAIAARHFGVNDNLFGASGETQARRGRLGCYLPVSVVALFIALLLAQISGLFVPALPLIALTMLTWYALRHLLRLKFKTQNREKPVR